MGKKLRWKKVRSTSKTSQFLPKSHSIENLNETIHSKNKENKTKKRHSFTSLFHWKNTKREQNDIDDSGQHPLESLQVKMDHIERLSELRRWRPTSTSAHFHLENKVTEEEPINPNEQIFSPSIMKKKSYFSFRLPSGSLSSIVYVGIIVLLVICLIISLIGHLNK